MPPPLVFTVRRGKPELIPPCKPTPHEMKQLSHIDEQEWLRFQMPLSLFYPAGKRGADNNNNIDNVGKVIKEALGKALVYYYPWAGRLREVHGPDWEKLVVDCTGEGVMFVDAEADVTLEELADDEGFLRPPFPCYDDLLFDVPGSSDILHSPLLLFQVTRLKCGGSVLAVRMNHTVSDGAGILQFLTAIAEISRGASQPSVMPIWRRQIFCFQCTPPHRITSMNHSQLTVFPVNPYDEDDDGYNNKGVIHRTFFFEPYELSIIRQRLHLSLRNCTTFELLAAFLWRCRILALRLHSLQHVSLTFVVNVRPKFNLHAAGYYGNAIVLPTAISQAGKIIASLDHAVELVKTAKAEVTPEFVSSVPVGPGPVPTHFQCTAANSWVISDNKPFNFLEIDFGWGKPVYGGAASDLMNEHVGPVSFFINGMNDKGQSGLLVPICLPPAAMDRFVKLVHFHPRSKM